MFAKLLGFHIHFSRLGLNNIWDGLFAVLLALFLSRAWRSQRPAAYVLPGIVLGLAQFFYVGSRVFLLLIPLWALLMLKLERTQTRLRIQGIAILILSTTIVVLPLALFFVRHPLVFLAPMARMNIFGDWWILQTIHYGDPAWFVISEQVLKALLGLVVVPLTGFYAGQPILNPPLAALFLVALDLLIRQRREPDSSWLGLWLLGAVLAVMFSTVPPAGQRYVVSSGAVAIVTALGFKEVLDWVPHTLKKRKALVRILTYTFLISALWQTSYYYAIYPTKEILADFNGATVDKIADSLRQHKVQQTYFFVSPRMQLASADQFRFLLPDLSSEDVADNPQWQFEITDPGEYAFVFLPEREPALDTIKTCLPGGVTHRSTTPIGHIYFLLYIVKTDVPVVCGPQGTESVGNIR